MGRRLEPTDTVPQGDSRLTRAGSEPRNRPTLRSESVMWTPLQVRSASFAQLHWPLSSSRLCHGRRRAVRRRALHNDSITIQVTVH
jgi:hypothetical protein